MQLSNLSIADLHALETEVSAELKNRHYLEISKAREQILYIAQNAGLSTDDLLSRKVPRVKSAAKVAVKYRNPVDANQVWTGRGRPPNWIKELLAQGKALSELGI